MIVRIILREAARGTTRPPAKRQPADSGGSMSVHDQRILFGVIAAIVALFIACNFLFHSSTPKAPVNGGITRGTYVPDTSLPWVRP